MVDLTHTKTIAKFILHSILKESEQNYFHQTSAKNDTPLW